MDIARRTGAPVCCTADLGNAVFAPAGVETIQGNLGGQMKLPFGSFKFTPAIHGSGVPGCLSCGFLFEMGGRKIYHAGDTSLTCDLALLEPEDGDWRLRIRCSKGTYVRALCHDSGQALGCGGCMSALRRTMAAGFTLAESRSIEDVQAQGEALLSPTDSLFRQYPAYHIAGERDHRRCLCGNPLAAEGLQPGLYRVYGPDGAFLCLSRWEAGVLTSEKNFFGA